MRITKHAPISLSLCDLDNSSSNAADSRLIADYGCGVFAGRQRHRRDDPVVRGRSEHYRNYFDDYHDDNDHHDNNNHGSPFPAGGSYLRRWR